VSNGNSLPTFQDNLSVPSSGAKNTDLLRSKKSTTWQQKPETTHCADRFGHSVALFNIVSTAFNACSPVFH